MNLDELTTVWRTQDAAPLHDMNQTLLHLALRQDEAKLQKQRRLGRWMVYLFSAGVSLGMALLLGLIGYHLAYHPGRNSLTGWDLVLPVVAAIAALISGRAIYRNHRAQTRREQGFGESLREQLRRGIAQLDDQVTEASRTSVLLIVLLGGVCPAAITLVTWRINGKSVSDDGYLLVTVILMCALSVVSGVWELRRQKEKAILPRKRRLETLLLQLDGQE